MQKRKVLMKVLFKKICLILAVIFSMSLVACGKENEDSEGSVTLKIELLEGGYGTTFLPKVAEAYQKTHPQIKFDITPDPMLDERMVVELEEGSSASDIYFGSSIKSHSYVERGDSVVAGYDCALADLTDVYESIIPGENIKIKDKIFSDYYDLYSINGKQYVMPWANSMTGIMYNKDVFEENGWEIPKTTDELLALCETIYKTKVLNVPAADQIYPFAWAGDNADGYWLYMFEAWWAQYEGLDNYKNFWQVNYDGGLAEAYQLYAQEGRLKALEVLAEILQTKDSKNIAKYYRSGSIVDTHTAAQLDLFEGKVAMMVTGDWCESEMKRDYAGKVKIEMMKTPVISDLGQKLNIDEETLSLIVSLIDDDTVEDYEIRPGNMGIPTTVSADAIAWIKEVRGVVYNIGPNHQIFIPAYSKHLDEAKDFLKFLVSDEALKICLREMGIAMPYNFQLDKNGKDSELWLDMSEFSQAQYELLQDTTSLLLDGSHPLRYMANVTSFNKFSSPIKEMASGGVQKSALQIWTEEYNYAKDNWSEWLDLANL